MSDGKGTFSQLKSDFIIAGVAGSVVAIAVASVSIFMGNISDAEARRLLEAIIPTSRLFCSSILTVAATILALMLTMIGLGSSAEAKLADAHYKRIVKIAFYDAVLFTGAAVMFIMHCVPVYESDSLPGWWYPSIYYGVLSASALLCGGAVAIVVLLYLAVKDVVEVIGLGKTDHHFAANPADETEETDSESLPN